MNWLILWLGSSLLLYVTAVLVPGFKITSFPRAMIATIIIGFLNMLIKPILIFLTLPINILTLGLFTFVINAIILRLAAGVMKGFDISGWFPAILAAMVMTFLRIIALAVFA